MNFPFIKQHDIMDCGPACLCMLAKYYGKEYSLKFIRNNSYIDRHGVSLLGLSKASELIGFQTESIKVEFKQLIDKVSLPCIIHWNQNHFVVLYKIKTTKKGHILYIADPGIGLLTYSKDEFCKHWISIKSSDEPKGLALTLAPTSVFYKQCINHQISVKNSKGFFLLKYLSTYKKFFSILILGLFVGSLLQLIFPFLMQSIVDIGIKEKNIHFIWLILIAQTILLISRTAIDFIRRKTLLHISIRINLSLLSDFLIKLMKLPMRFFDIKLTGDLLQRIEDHRRVENFLTTQFINTLFSFFTFIILGSVLFIYNITIFLIFLIGSIIYGAWMSIFLSRRKILDYKKFEKEGLNRNIIYQLITSIQEIKLQGCAIYKRKEWENIQGDIYNINIQHLNLLQIQEAGRVFINELKNILITILAATSVIEGDITLGVMLAIQYIVGQLNYPVEQLMNFIYLWQDVNISLDRINEIHAQNNEEDDSRDVKMISKEGSIVFKNVSFKYNSIQPLYNLKSINLIIPRNKITAIVGSSGSGKTTLLKLLLGFYLPNIGEVNIGNINIDKIDVKWWRTQCGAVMQDGYLFSDTIAQNIAISDTNINIDKLRKAAKMANISNYIESLPLGYNTKIGQDGQGLSQGQRQRILIARVIYKDPSFVFFDEATNALDASNEKEIINNLYDFFSDKTVVIIAHRLSTVKNADQIIVLNNGSIEEIGSHEELTVKQGKYFELVKDQLELGN